MKKILLTLTVTLCIASHAYPQRLEAQTVNYKPNLYGAVKAAYQMSLYDGRSRFVINNVRVGLRGSVSRNISYNIQTDIGAGRDFTLLDASAKFSSAGWEIELGQQPYKFSRDIENSSPTTLIFNSASLLSTYITGYNGTNASGDYVSSLGSRDIGLRISYATATNVPLTFTAGLFNGTGAANPVWDRGVNLVGRIDIGAKKGLGGAVSHYNGEAPVATRAEGGGFTSYRPSLVMWGAELRYNSDRYIVEGEVGQRRLGVETTQGRELRKLLAARVQGYYIFPVGKGVFEFIMPTLRWDMVNDAEYITQGVMQTFSAQRATAGINFGFVENILKAEVRLNFEKFFFNDKPFSIADNVAYHDKVVMDIVIAF